MFTKEQLEGIIISLANPEIAIEKDRHHSIGYKIILRVHFRVKNKDYLLELQETLRANGIDSYLKDEEKKSRPYPVLRITNIDNLFNFLKLIPNKPKHNQNKFEKFVSILDMVSKKHHLTQKGFDKILKIQEIVT